MTHRRVLVVGTRPFSLGEAIYLALYNAGVEAVRADKPPAIDDTYELDSAVYKCNITDRVDVIKMLEVLRPTDVVCCVGVNLDDEHLWLNAVIQNEVNYLAPLQLLDETISYWNSLDGEAVNGYNFVAISSNSAHIARSKSAGYCASKAALSMALRCVARNYGGRDGYCIWGYEPGFIVGTLMSQEVEERMPNAQLHRIPGGHGLDKWALADGIAHDIIHVQHAFNGCMFRLDGGEQ